MLERDDLEDYQFKVIDHILNNKRAGVFADMGSGKTVCSLIAVETLKYAELEIDNILIIAPKRVVESVWGEEIAKWSMVKNLTIVKVIGTQKQRKAALKEKADIHIISRDNVAWLCGLYGGLKLPYDMIIIDESSSFKNHQSVRFRALRTPIHSVNRAVLLTGTPAPNGLLDIWAQIYLLDKGARLGRTMQSYREAFFRAGKRNGAIIYNYIPREGMVDEIHRRISDICISLSVDDYLDLKPRVYNDVFVDLPPKIQKQYDDFERDLVLELFEDDTVITAVNAGALFNKLTQFANGAVYDADKNYSIVHDLKIEALKDIVEDANGKPVLIAYGFRHDLERIIKALKKYNPVKMETSQHIKDWNEGKIQVMVMHPASGGHGLNLQFGGHIAVWFGQTTSLEYYQQFNKRLERPGQKFSMHLNRLIARHTIDEDIVRMLSNKDVTQKGLIDAVKIRIDKYVKNH